MPRNSFGDMDLAKLSTILVQTSPAVQPNETLERILGRIWAEVLPGAPPSLLDDFFQSGGDSLKAVDLLLRIDQEIGVSIAPDTFFRCPTIEGLVGAIQTDAGFPGTAIVAIQEPGHGIPFFFFHGDFNGWGFFCPRFARLLGAAQRFYTFHPDGLPGQPMPTTISAMVDRYLPLLREVQPTGPYLLGGHCNGALVAFEIASRLERFGERVELLALVSPPLAPEPGRIQMQNKGISPQFQLQKQAPKVRRALLYDIYAQAIRCYQPSAIAGKIHLLATANDLGKGGPAMGWDEYAASVEVCPIPGGHLSVLSHHLEDIAGCIRPLLSAAAPLE